MTGPVPAQNSASVKAQFANPGREYSSGPLWVWHDMLTEKQIAETLEDLASQHVKQAFVHPRPGLMTPYLSEDWFRLWRVALREAGRLDMNIWIYDENSYPSGFAGGFVPEAMPESQGRGLHIREEKTIGALDSNVIAVFRDTGGAFEDITKAARNGQTFPEGAYLIASIERSAPSPWYGGKWYVDLLYPGVTEKFLEITMDAYRREIGDQFGKRVPGVFTDEPHTMPAKGMPWTEDLPRAFEARWGYSLLENLPSLVRETGDWRRVRHNYYQLVLELFIERWAKPYYEYCERHGLEFTGHYWEHDWPRANIGPDNMAMYAWHQRPAIDTLFNQYNEGVHAQFGNVRAVLELNSVGNQLGRRTLCEAYGGSGWDARFEDLKRIGDWLFALGVNTLNQHLSDITLRGARKRDYPPTFSYHTPWWDSYGALAQYFTRLSLALTRGEQVNTILVIEPTTTAWMYQTTQRERMEALGDAFQLLVTNLAKAQVEFDIGSENIMARHGAVEGKRLRVGRRLYDTVVLPPLTENLNAPVMDLLGAYAKAGGALLCAGEAPSLVDGRPSDHPGVMAQQPGWKTVAPEALAGTLLAQAADGFAIRMAEGASGILYHNRRRLTDGELLFLVNTSIDAAVSGVIESTARGVENWNAESGAVEPYPAEVSATGLTAAFELPPCGSLLLFLSQRPTAAAAPPFTRLESIDPAGDLAIRRDAPNVLTIDYVDLIVGGKSTPRIHFHRANRMVFQAHGFENNPWDHAVQFRDELISKTFPPESGFEATYCFTIEGAVPNPLHMVIERPDLYTITCNGQPVSAAPGDWWLDRAFGKVDITAAAKTGANEVTIKAAPFTMFHELESAYVLGAFALRPAEQGFVIIPESGLRLGPWKDQGLPLYAHGVTYARTFNVAEPSGRYAVTLPAWYGSVAKVSVNGALAGHIYHQPWECDVTASIKPGVNTIEVTVTGTLKNTLGPHHGNKPLGIASPSSFHDAPEAGPPPGETYDTIGYGLFEPFHLVRRSAE